MSEDEFLQYLSQNKEWIFSGIGVLFLSVIISLAIHFLNKKRRYIVCIRRSDHEDMRAFKIGWSWSAFLFSFFWMSAKGLYDFMSIYFGLIGVLFLHGFILDSLFDTNILHYVSMGVIILFVSTPLFLGLFGNLLVMRKYCHSYNLLSEDHYSPVKQVIASSELDAISILMNK